MSPEAVQRKVREMRMTLKMSEHTQLSGEGFMGLAKGIAQKSKQGEGGRQDRHQSWEAPAIVSGTPFVTEVEPRFNGIKGAEPEKGRVGTPGNIKKNTSRHHYQYSAHTGWRSLHKKGAQYEALRQDGFEGPAIYRGHGTQGGAEVDPDIPYPISGYSTLGKKKTTATQLGTGHGGEPALFFA